MTTLNQPLPSPAGELLSALIDGELAAHEVCVAFEVWNKDLAMRGNWNNYLLIGETLRTAVPASTAFVQSADVAFLERFTQRLKGKEIAGDALSDPVSCAEPKSVVAVVHHRGSASNDGNFRWKLVAGFASLGTVVSVVWSLSGLSVPASTPTLAEVRQGALVQQVVIASELGPMARDARLEELLAAHKQMGGTSLQAPSGFLRSASFEAPQLGRR